MSGDDVHVVRVGGRIIQPVSVVSTATNPIVTPAHQTPDLDDLGDVSAPADSPSGTDLVFRRDTDGVFRLIPAAAPEERWGDQIRVGDYVPTDDAPAGAVHFDTANGRIYRNGSTP